MMLRIMTLSFTALSKPVRIRHTQHTNTMILSITATHHSDEQPNNNQHDDTKPQDSQHKDTQH